MPIRTRDRNKEDYYELLGAEKSVSEEELKKAHRIPGLGREHSCDCSGAFITVESMTNILAGIVGLVLGFGSLAIWVYALVSAIKNERLNSNMRLIWVLVVLFANILGAVLYLLVAPNRPHRLADA